MARGLLPYSKAMRSSKVYHPHLFSLSGDSATGTSTTMEWLKRHFPEYFSVMSSGDEMRKFARGDIDRFTAEAHAGKYEGSYDQRVDNAMRYFGSRDYFCGDGRVSYLFIPEGFHARQICFNPDDSSGYFERARRRHAQLKKNSPNSHPCFEEVLKKLMERDRLDGERYDIRYPGWRWEDSDFDCIVNSFFLDPEQIVEEILRKHKIWVAEKGHAIQESVCLFH